MEPDQWIPLTRSMPLAPGGIGLYIVRAGDCVAHIGTGKNLRRRIRQLVSLKNHRGSTEVLCAAYCTRQPPMARFESFPDVESARRKEADLKKENGEPPYPRPKYEPCVNGHKLREDLLAAAGGSSWEAGYISATFDIGEQLYRIFTPRFKIIWERVGVPPGPWPTYRD